jgi:leucyl-tRNA---protein transferase
MAVEASMLRTKDRRRGTPRMQTLFTFVSPPNPCGYLPDRRWSLRYEVVGELTPDEYGDRLRAGWRRFGYSLFRPECETCRECKSLRVDVARFKPSATQKRVWKQNHGAVTVTVGQPIVTAEKLALYDRFHEFQSGLKGWPEHDTESAVNYIESFVENPFVTQEWCYYVGDRLIGVGYVDHLPVGLSAIYFFYDPDERHRSPGVFNVLSVIRAAAEQRLPHVYLGFYVNGCRSLDYKAKYRPNEVLVEGEWRPFLDG